MLEKLKLVEARYLEMAERAAQPDFYNDPKAASQLLKEQRQLEPIITAYRSYMKTTQEQDDLRAMLSEGLDPEMKALCQEEFSANKKKLEELEQELKILLLPRDPNDDKSVIMEIRGGVELPKRAVRPQPVPDVHDVRRVQALDGHAVKLQRNRAWRREGGRF